MKSCMREVEERIQGLDDRFYAAEEHLVETLDDGKMYVK